MGEPAVPRVQRQRVRNDQILLQTGDLYTRDGLTMPEVYPLNCGDRAPNITTLTGYSLGTGLFGTHDPTNLIGNYYTLAVWC